MRRSFFSPSSRHDLIEILEYVAKDKPGAAVRLVERLEDSCRMLAKNSELGTARDDLKPGIRAWAVGQYVIFFRRVRDGIEVVRVVHGARDAGTVRVAMALGDYSKK
jgi:toxin ParE1/3/4